MTSLTSSESVVSVVRVDGAGVTGATGAGWGGKTLFPTSATTTFLESGTFLIENDEGKIEIINIKERKDLTNEHGRN